MARFRAPILLANLLAAIWIALLPGAAGASWEGAVTLAALSLTDVLLAGTGFLVAAMAGFAGVLVVTDVLTDAAAARAWQGIDIELALVVTAAETVPVVPIDTRYTAGPQDEGLRRILLAHRFIVPVPLMSDTGSAAPGRTDTAAAGDVDGVRSVTELLRAGQHPVADGHRALMPETSSTAFACPPTPITGKVKEFGRRGQKRREPRALLVANAGMWWNCPTRLRVEGRTAPADIHAADVIVLADRSGRDGISTDRAVTPEPATTAQPGCRGPPSAASRRQVASDPTPVTGSVHETVQQRDRASADPVVIDSLGDRVPVGAAELEVVERYLDDVLAELLATVASGQNHGKS